MISDLGLRRTWRIFSRDFPTPTVECHQHETGRNCGEKQTFGVKRGHARAAEQAVKPAADERPDSAGGDTHARIISTQADDFAGDKAQEGSQNDPADDADQHDERVEKRKKPTQPNPEGSGFACVGLLVNGSSGFWPKYPLFSHPRTSILLREAY